ncbi:hypothetical protein HBI70_121600 [Parastagonospora nodorum]|nr:hypothetical protein HBH53_037600 [Parastagonospora nodorum]KAH4000689.1 hypothetical protein HBI10_100520 [Parastagonospora nodorum]KAH4026662.1 hypothetical protein HBI13_065090 [Parastagonospora nodorum]KAH4051866.1 hypothetical protein HBH49_109020 [Parastagonospora nodorum]KAH4224127.1 hypothetical protein HBI06_126410 [Parastagonospora nodorum]
MNFLSTISTLFFPTCLRSDTPSPPHRTNIRTIECNQYGRRLYLRPIMPPTTRRQSTVMVREEGGEQMGRAQAKEERMDTANAERRVDSAERMDSAHVEEVLERKQSRITFDVPVKESAGNGNEDVVTISAKRRTLSVEMHEAIEALHREDEEQERNLAKTPASETESGSETGGEVSASESGESSPATPTSVAAPITPSSSNRSAIIGVGLTERPDLQYHTPSARPVLAQVPPAEPWVMYYDCAGGKGCVDPVRIKQGEPIRCKECGFRSVYKRRTNRMVQFEAR